VFLGVFLLAIDALQLEESGASIVQSFGWVYAITGITLVLVGLEAISLVKHLPAEPGHQMARPDNGETAESELTRP
jgi:hypothetical protein